MLAVDGIGGPKCGISRSQDPFGTIMTLAYLHYTVVFVLLCFLLFMLFFSDFEQFPKKVYSICKNPEEGTQRNM